MKAIERLPYRVECAYANYAVEHIAAWDRLVKAWLNLPLDEWIIAREWCAER